MKYFTSVFFVFVIGKLMQCFFQTHLHFFNLSVTEIQEFLIPLFISSSAIFPRLSPRRNYLFNPLIACW